MKQRLRLCLLAAGLLCAAAPAPAQTGPPRMRLSHVPIEGGISPDAADAFLQGRLRDAQTTADLERLISELAKHPERLGIDNSEDQRKLRQAIISAGGKPERLLDDPDLRRIIGEAAQKRAEQFNLGAEDRQRLEDLARRFGLREPGRSDADPPGGPGPKAAGASPGGSDSPATPPDAGAPSAQTPPSDPLPPAPPPPAPPPPENSAMNDHLRDIADALADSPLADSPAFRRMVASLGRVRTPEAAGFTSWDQRLEQWQERFASVGSRMPKFSWTKGDAAPLGPAGRAPAGPVLPAETTGGGTEVVFLILGAATAGLIAWGLLRRRGLLGLGGPGGGWRLGPWPVRPEAVATRDELVRAFEYLALLRLGPAARSQNHRDIAAGLGAEDEARRPAAERLAGLYEQARYAPPDEALPDADLADARAALSLLAGVAAA
jgi:hypothetical protein